MSAENKVYNVKVLANVVGLDTAQGIDRNGTRRAYFDKLSSYVDEAGAAFSKMEETKNRKKFLSELYKLQTKLADIGDMVVVRRVEKLIDFLEAGDKNADVRDKLFHLQKVALHLRDEIKKAEMSLDEEEQEQFEDEDEARPEEEEKPTAIPEIHNVRPSAFVQAKHFEKLVNAVGNADFDFALSEAKGLMLYTYDERVDGLLEKIVSDIQNHAFSAAATETKRLWQHAQLVEGNHKKAAQKKKILSVDDVPDVLNTLKSMLKDDYNIYCVTNHTTALKFLAANTPDLILLDIEMPDMNGFDLLKIIRQIDACKDTPVIFLTGNANVENVKTAIEMKGNDFIRKPVDYDILINKIRRYIG